MDNLVPMLRIAILAVVLALILTDPIDAYRGIPLYWYGDKELGKQTAFAESWRRPAWVPAEVRHDWPGVALQDYAPGTKVRLTVVGLPGWAETWPELEEVVGKSMVGYVADRPGGEFADAWPYTFRGLCPLWVGKLYVEIEVVK